MKKKLLLIILLLIFVKTYSQETINANQGFVENKEYFSKMKYENKNGKIIIKVSIDKNEYDFLIDTGSTTAISEDLFNLIRTKKLGSVKINDQSGITDSLEVVSIPEIKINDIEFKEIPVFVSKNNLNPIFECFKIDGIIGSNLLRNSTIQFDSQKSEIILTNDSKNLGLKKRDAIEMKVSEMQSNPFIPIKLIKENHEGNGYVLFDSGDNDFYVISNTAYHQLQSQVDIFETIAKNVGTFSMGLFGTANENEHLALKIKKLKIADIDFNNVTTKTTYGETSRIGLELLKFGKVTLDYKKERFWLESFNEKKSIKLSERMWPIEPILNKNNEIVVGIIWDNSLKNKVNLGDKILQFGNIDYENMKYCEILNLTSKVNKSKAKLIYQDKNTKETKELELNSL
ncbi:MAG: hypothetical protein CMO82_13145 [Winogradskyella sp.]|nr:hypothetical protein [Winogradskyella sp.]